MPTQTQTFPIKFEGGLITNKGRVEQGIEFPGSATQLQNYEADVRGGYSRIKGFTKFSTIAVPGTGVVKAVIGVEPSKVLAIRNNKFYSSSGTSWTDLLTIPSPTATRAFYESYDHGSGLKFVIVDGVNYPAFYSALSGTMAYGVGFPTDLLGASLVRSFKSHLFYAVGKNLVFGAPFSDTDFTPANGGGIINIGDSITGLISFREQLFIFCVGKIFRLSGDSVENFKLDPVTTNTGCICGHTVQEVGGDIMYLSSDGVRYLSASERENDFGLNRASEKIQSEFNRINTNSCRFSATTLSAKNQYRIFVYEENVLASSAKGFIAVKFSDQSTDNISWSTTLGIKVHALSKFTERGGDHIFFCNETGYVYRMESGNSFDGENIPSIFETPYMPVEDPRVRKTYYKHTLYTRVSTSVDLFLELLLDYKNQSVIQPPVLRISSLSTGNLYGDPSTVYGTAVYSVPSEIELSSNVLGSSFVVALRYTNNSTQESFNLNFATLEFRNNERR